MRGGSRIPLESHRGSGILVINENPFVRVGRDIGKLLEITDEIGVVEFFDAPVRDGSVHINVPLNEIRRIVLELQTRVWWEDAGQWQVGRVVAPPDGNASSYWIGLTNKRKAEVEANRLYVRWSRPLRDPVRMLEARVVDSRFHYGNRSAFVGEVLRHRGAVQGLTGISSSSVRLHKHQVLAARRVLQDPVRRYLLADEVGLGKTIEAGMIIRQTMLEKPNCLIVVAAPPALVTQWETELSEKFNVQDLEGGQVAVLSHQELSDQDWTSGITPAMVVIDEAHRLVEGAQSEEFTAICALAHSVPSLLLLSATPARSNEVAFFQLLHLLDPASYRLDDIDGFRTRIESRDKIGNALTLLRDGVSLFLLAEAAESLSNCFPDDPVILGLTKSLIAKVENKDEGDARSEARTLRHYVSDTYRLHRRMIRTRREETGNENFPVRGRRWHDDPELLDADSRRPQIVEVLDRFRSGLAGADDLPLESVLKMVAERCSAATPAIAELIRALRGDPMVSLTADESIAVTALQGHHSGSELADELASAIKADQADGRLTAMTEWAWSHADRRKVSAITSYQVVGRAAFELMQERYGEHRVAALLSDMDADELDNQYRRALHDDRCVLLICDSVAEEGWNLQFIAEILHLDIPWSINRLEQRIGRFDRFAFGYAMIGPVVSKVCVDIAALRHITGAWTTFVDEAFDIFRRSTAALQYVLPEREAVAIEIAIDAGFGAMQRSAVSEKQLLDDIRITIEGQDLLDAIEDDREERDFYEAFRGADSDGRHLGRATLEWVGMSLNLKFSGDDSVGKFGISKRNPPLITETELRSIGISSLDRRFSVRRQGAGTNGIGILRPGHPLIDAFHKFTVIDARGICFGVVKELPGLTSEMGVPVFFRFDLLIEPTRVELDDERSLAAHSMALKYFSPMVENILHSRTRAEPTPEHAEILLRDHQLNLADDPKVFSELTAGFNWASTCRLAETAAREAVSLRASVVSRRRTALELLDLDGAKAAARGRARERSFGEVFDAPKEEKFFEMVREALSVLTVSTIGCGVVFLVPTGSLVTE